MGTFNVPMRVLAGLVALLAIRGVLAPEAGAGQIDSAAYFHLRRGMSESEVLVRAGPPDLVTSPGLEAVEVKHGVVEHGDEGEVTFDTFRRTRIPTVAQWHYVPGPEESDPFITIITFRAGEIWELERTKVFSRHKAKSVEPAAEREASSDIQRERADNTLKAAEAYAATRARLKEQAGDDAEAAPATEGTTIYKSVQPDGSTYFGDTPPGESPKVISVD